MILREKGIIGDMTDLNCMIIVGDISHRLVEQDSIRNIWIPEQDKDT